MTQSLGYFAVLIAMGAGWGLTQPLLKIAVSTGLPPFGLLVWQLAVTSMVLFALNLFRGAHLPVAPRHLIRYALIALVGTLVPNSITYRAAVFLPSGILSIMISLVPMFALPLALGFGLEKFAPMRSLGVVCGAVAIVMLVLPQTSLPNPTVAIWVLILAISPLMYAIEATWVARFGIADLDPVQLLLGASLFGLVVMVPVALASGQWVDLTRPWGRPIWSLHASSVIHALVYASYVWLVGRAGSVFASQVAYWVTGFGVFWAILILGEHYSGWVWGAMATMMIGLFLVRPRVALVLDANSGDTTAKR